MFYNWVCKDCNKVKETMSTIKDKKAPECPKCGKIMKQVFNNINTLPGSLRQGYVK